MIRATQVLPWDIRVTHREKTEKVVPQQGTALPHERWETDTRVTRTAVSRIHKPI